MVRVERVDVAVTYKYILDYKQSNSVKNTLHGGCGGE